MEQLVVAAVRSLVGTFLPQMPEASSMAVECTRDTTHGHYTSKVAMRLAQAVGREPREVARAIVAAVPPNERVARVEAAANGFINFFLAPAALAQELRRIHEQGSTYGRSSLGAGHRLRVGLLSSVQDVSQARYAAYSESLAKVLETAGYEVERAALAEAPAVPGVAFCRGSVSAQVGSLHALREELSDDSCRFFFLMRSHEHSLDFDLQLATSRRLENPLFSVQYAHARVASAMKEMRARGISFDLAVGLGKLERLDQRTEQALIATLLRFAEEVESAAANCAPHAIVYYLREVANAVHTYHAAEKWIVEEIDLRNARLALVLAAGQVLRNGLALIGVSAPESM